MENALRILSNPLSLNNTFCSALVNNTFCSALVNNNLLFCSCEQHLLFCSCDQQPPRLPSGAATGNTTSAEGLPHAPKIRVIPGNIPPAAGTAGKPAKLASIFLPRAGGGAAGAAPAADPKLAPLFMPKRKASPETVSGGGGSSSGGVGGGRGGEKASGEKEKEKSGRKKPSLPSSVSPQSIEVRLHHTPWTMNYM